MAGGSAGVNASSAAGAVVLPLLATQILWINLITDAGPALAMGVDPIADDVMARQPRRLSQPMIDRHMWAGVLGTGLVTAAVTLITIDMFLPGGLIAGSHTLDLARTAGSTVLVPVLWRSSSTVSTPGQSRPVPGTVFSPTIGRGARWRCRRCCRWPWCTSGC